MPFLIGAGMWTKSVAARALGLKQLGFLAAITFSSSARSSDIRLGYFPNVTHAQALYARGTGYFETNANLRIAWTSFSAGPTVIEALFSDAIDASYVGPNPAINGYLRSHGDKFAI